MNRLFIIIFILINFIFSIENYNVNGWELLSLEEKIGQMIMVRINGNYYQSDNQYKKSLKKWIRDYNIGGVIAFSGSVHGTFYNIKEFQEWAKTPLFVAADYERGVGQWIDSATLFPSNMAVAATGLTFTSLTRAETAAEHNAEELAAAGANPFSSSVMPSMFSPVVDMTGFENHNK